MSPELPDRPSLEQLKKQAKALLRDAQAGKAAAIARLAALPAFAGRAPAEIAGDAALHDAQSAIAREYGFTSWNALRDELEARLLSFDGALDEFIRAATAGVTGRAERLLALHPKLAHASLQTELVLGDAAGALARLSDHPELATTPGGPHGWEPLLYVCHTEMHKTTAGNAAGLVAIARDLLARGANANAEYHWNWHPELPRTALWAAVCVAANLPLAETLLEAGANPTDGVTAHIASGSGNLPALDLLARFGLNPNGVPGGVPPLVYMMLWARTAPGIHWLLDRGADPNLPWGPDAEAPLHVAARRWDPPVVEALVARGADMGARRADGRMPRTIAELYGNQAVAAWLAAHGAPEELATLDRFIAACARADRGAAQAMLAADPTLPARLQPGDHLMLHRPAESGNVETLETMLACGFDPNVGDKDRVTALHRAAMAGSPAAVEALIQAGADVGASDGMFAAPPLVWAVEGRRHAGPAADHVAVARILIASGSPIEWTPPEGAPSPEGTLEGLVDLRRAAARLTR